MSVDVGGLAVGGLSLRHTPLRFVWRSGPSSGLRAALAATRLESLRGSRFAPERRYSS